MISNYSFKKKRYAYQIDSSFVVIQLTDDIVETKGLWSF